MNEYKNEKKKRKIANRFFKRFFPKIEILFFNKKGKKKKIGVRNQRKAKIFVQERINCQNEVRSPKCFAETSRLQMSLL